MKEEKADVVVIGAGLTGLTIAYLLRDHDVNLKILEAKNRVGGRIFTKLSNNNTTIDLGATWIQKPHTHLLNLLAELNVEIFQQKIGSSAIYEPNTFSKGQYVNLPPNNEPSYRVKGGTISILNALLKYTAPSTLFFNQKVKSIERHGSKLQVTTATSSFATNQVISTLPPYLFANSINLSPTLPENVNDVLQSTHTWMGESIKAGLVYDNPFWKTENFTGTIFSNIGPVIEFYDHSNFEESTFALKGFIKDELASLTKESRLEMILNQLRKYYGDQVNTYLSYEEMVWRADNTTTLPYKNFVLPHQNNGHPIFQEPYFDNQLLLAGTETAASFGGYMEGAIRSAEFVTEHILKYLQLV